MQLEHIFLIITLLIGAYFTGQLVMLYLRRPYSLQVSGFKHYDRDDPFRHHITKRYPGLTLSFYPLVLGEAIMMTKSKGPQFHGIVCQCELLRIERPLFEQLSLHFDRVEQSDEHQMSLYKEDIEFNTPAMKVFVEQLDQIITQYLEHHSSVVV
jgi:hypothetical protein